uniref:Histone-lysine N-methyltransferase ATXR4 n=1 Tax=Anthurium amnicola TaxID=1678845 RepID=A0A1D1YKN5_9ARAE
MSSVAGSVLRRSARPTLHRAAALSRSPPSSSSLLSTSTSVSGQSGHVASGGAEVYTPAASGPPPIRVSMTESSGRGVFATRPIGAGDLIHTASPMVAHPSASLLHKVCYKCLRRRGSGEIPALSGSNDNVYYFCSEKCRERSKGFLEVESRLNWSAYENHCKERGLKYPFLVKRLACMVVSGTASEDCLDILQPDSIYPEMMREMEEEFELLKLAFVKATIEDALMAFLTKHWYFGVLARIRINAFRVETVGGSYEDLLTSASSSVAADSAVGNAIYMLPSFYNHDCGIYFILKRIGLIMSFFRSKCTHNMDRQCSCEVESPSQHRSR